MLIAIETSRDIVNFNLKRECKTDNVRKAPIEQFIVEWNQQLLQKTKLRTYVTFKHVFATETYVMQTLSRSRRSFLAQFRLGILPLEIETGRYTPIYDKHTKKNRKRHPSERLCTSCNMGLCEDEVHFILICPLYSNIRQSLLNSILTDNPNFSNLSNPDQMIYLMQFCQHNVMSYIQSAWRIRSSNSCIKTA